MYRNARPLDIARWKYHFEDGSKEEVLKALAAYQNLDGGFAHALEVFLQDGYSAEMHEIPCFIRFYEYCTKAMVTDIFDADKMKNSLKKAVKSLIEEDTESWKNDYVCKPSHFMITPDSMFYPDNKKVSDYEAEFIVETINSDGTWNITWNWSDYLKEWELSKNWWKANVILLNLRYLKGFEMGLL